MKKRGEKALGIMIGLGKGKGKGYDKEEEMDEEMDEDAVEEDKLELAKSFKEAMEDDDPEGMASALEAFFELCSYK